MFIKCSLAEITSLNQPASRSNLAEKCQYRSFVDIVISERQDEEGTERFRSSPANLERNEVSTLRERIAALEEEISLLKSHLRLENSISDSLLRLLDAQKVEEQSGK